MVKGGVYIYQLNDSVHNRWNKNTKKYQFIQNKKAVHPSEPPFIIHIPLILRGTAIPTNLHTLSSHRSMGTLYEHSRSTDNALQS